MKRQGRNQGWAAESPTVAVKQLRSLLLRHFRCWLSFISKVARAEHLFWIVPIVTDEYDWSFHHSIISKVGTAYYLDSLGSYSLERGRVLLSYPLKLSILPEIKVIKGEKALLNLLYHTIVFHKHDLIKDLCESLFICKVSWGSFISFETLMLSYGFHTIICYFLS